MKNKFLFPLVFATIFNVNAQQFISGTPYTMENILDDSYVPIEKMPVSENAHLWLNIDDDKDSPVYKFAHPFPVNYSIENSGVWEDLPNGDKLWRLGVLSKSAKSLNFIFSKFHLEIGAKLFIYNEDYSLILGAFTSQNNKLHGKFSTDVIEGDKVYLEYYLPNGTEQGELELKTIAHGYKDIGYSKDKSLGASSSCNVDIQCHQGNYWCFQKKGVVMILLNDGTEWCSGSLINNTTEIKRPYILTAFHCADGNRDGVLSQTEVNDANTWMYRFNYWQPSCNSGNTTLSFLSYSGSTFRAGWVDTDFLLTELNSTISTGNNVHYNGWDRRGINNIPSDVIAIHHPSGDAMKIGRDYDSPSVDDWRVTGVNTHWLTTNFEFGTLEKGSSGSPLFDGRKIIGQLSGNKSYYSGIDYCTIPFGSYGRLDLSWNGGGTLDTRLRDWLDPNGTNVQELDGFTPKRYLINKQYLFSPFTQYPLVDKFSAGELQLEGFVDIYSGSFCPDANQEFIVGNNVGINFKSRNEITLKKGVRFKQGCEVTLSIQIPQCGTQFITGDRIDGGCSTNAQARSLNPNSSNQIYSVTKNNESDVDVSQFSIFIYPNPTTGSVYIKSENGLIDNIKIFDIQGREQLLIVNVNAINTQLDISNLVEGVYLLKVISNNGNHSITRIVKMK